MSNEITKPNGPQLPATADDNPFLSYGEGARQTSIVGTLLKFSKGDWYAGTTNEVVENGTRFVANMDEFLRGWVRWQDNRPTDHIMGKVLKGYKPPRRNELGDDDRSKWEVDENGQERDPWQETNYLLMMGVDGEMKGELYTFTTSSIGGRNSVADLSMRYGKVYRQKGNQHPVIEIGSGSYKHSNKNYGFIKYPVFKIVGWLGKDKFVKPEGDALEDDRPGEVETPSAVKAPTEPAKPRAKARF